MFRIALLPVAFLLVASFVSAQPHQEGPYFQVNQWTTQSQANPHISTSPTGSALTLTAETSFIDNAIDGLVTGGIDVSGNRCNGAVCP